MSDLITVLMPIFNGAKYLPEAIGSVLRQTYANLEILVVDDGSTDESAAIVERISDPRLRLVRNFANEGLVRTLNKGVALAQGTYLARMDADDIAAPQRLERQLEYIAGKPHLHACGTYAYRIDETGATRGLIRKPRGAAAGKSAWLPTPLIHPTVMFRTEVARQFPYSEGATHCEDYELWLRLVRAGHQIDNCPEPLLYYRVHTHGVSQAYREEQLRNTFAVFRSYYPLEITQEEFGGLIGAHPNLGLARRLQLTQALRKLGCRAWVPELRLFIRDLIR